MPESFSDVTTYGDNGNYSSDPSYGPAFYQPFDIGGGGPRGGGSGGGTSSSTTSTTGLAVPASYSLLNSAGPAAASSPFVAQSLQQFAHDELNYTLTAYQLNNLTSEIYYTGDTVTINGVTYQPVTANTLRLDWAYNQSIPFIAQEYSDELGRAASSSDLSNWEYQFGGGTQNLATERAILGTSQEAANDLNSFFVNDLGRSIEPTALAAYEGELTSGVTLNDVGLQIASSGEAGAEIDNIYVGILNRAVDPGSAGYWASELAAGDSLPSIRYAIAMSAESQADLGSLYETVLWRGADPAGLAAWTNAEINGDWLALVRESLAQGGEAQADIANLYQSVLGRAATASDLSGDTSYLSNIGSLASLQAELAVSPEEANAIGGIYSAVVGRPDSSGDLSFWQGYMSGQGAELQTIRIDVAMSTEASNDVNSNYTSILSRSVGAAELGFWQNWLAVTGDNLSAIQPYLANTAEAATDITNAFQHVLGRAPLAGDLSFWQGWLGTAGNAFSSVVPYLAGTAEALGAVAAIYSSIDGRPATAAELSAGQQNLADGSETLSSEKQTEASGPEFQQDLTNFLADTSGGIAPNPNLMPQLTAVAAGGGSLLDVASAASSAGSFDSAVTQTDTILGKAASDISTDISTFRATVSADLSSLATTAISWSTIISNLSEAATRFIVQQVETLPPEATTLTPAQLTKFADVKTQAINESVSLPANTPLINNSPLLTAFANIFNPLAPSYHSFPLTITVNHADHFLTQQDSDQYLGRVIVPGNVFASPISNGKPSSVYADGMYAGQVNTFQEVSSHTFLNATITGHLLDSGVVAVQNIEHGYSTTFNIYGVGQNADPQLAALNSFGAKQFVFPGVVANFSNLVSPFSPPLLGFSP